MELETERLRIRKVRPTDLDDFHAYRSDPEVCRYQGYPPIPYEDARAWIAKMQDQEYGKPHEWCMLGVEHKESGRLIGDYGLKPETNVRNVEYGVSYSREYHGMGLASEGLAALITYLFREMNVHRVIGLVDVDNAACIRMMERLGFRREAHYRESFDDQGVWRDEYLYAVLASEWREKI